MNSSEHNAADAAATFSDTSAAAQSGAVHEINIVQVDYDVSAYRNRGLGQLLQLVDIIAQQASIACHRCRDARN